MTKQTMRPILLICLVSALFGCGNRAQGGPEHCPPSRPAAAVRPPPEPVAEQPQPEYAEEALVEISFQGTWYAGTVVQWLRDDLYEVAYDGYGDDWNRVAHAEQLRPRQQEAANPLPLPGFEVTDVQQLTRRQPVFVEWGDTWYPATVRRIDADQTWVRYTGYEKEWDEAVGVDRIRTMQDPNGAPPARNAPPATFPPDPRN